MENAMKPEYLVTEATAIDELISSDDLIEEVSIDGMCGVY
jgi:mycofactocin precursor